MSDKRYLEWHGAQWRVQVKVPPSLHGHFRKKRLVHPLGTDSLANANRLKWDVVAKLKREIDAARRQVSGSPQTVEQEALLWRKDIATERPMVETVSLDPSLNSGLEEVEVEHFAVRDELLPQRAAEIREAKGQAAAAAFVKIAKGEATPIHTLIDTYFKERKLQEAQQRDYRRAYRRLTEWLESVHLPTSVEAITRKTAGRFILETMVEKGRHPKTANKDISAISSFWKWLIKRGVGDIESNPWSEQSFPKSEAPKSTKRPFHDSEVQALLKGTTDLLLLDVIRVAALSGMRQGEIASLTVDDCRDQLFNIRDAKTEAGNRKTPIHSALVDIVERRCKSKQGDAMLFDELGDDRTSDQRASIISKRFLTYRRSVGVHEDAALGRGSNVDFHSFRRWFITKARDALLAGAKGFDLYTIAEVVGHDKGNPELGLPMTMGVYAAAQPMEAKRACVEAVVLPR